MGTSKNKMAKNVQNFWKKVMYILYIKSYE